MSRADERAETIACGQANEEMDLEGYPDISYKYRGTIVLFVRVDKSYLDNYTQSELEELAKIGLQNEVATRKQGP